MAAALLCAAPASADAQTAPGTTPSPTSTADLRPAIAPSDAGRVTGDLPPADRIEPAEPDLRLEADRQAFSDPPAGYDPRRFQIEPVPREDRRIHELYDIEPYEQIGWRMGGFILFGEVEAGGGWNSNVFYTPDAHADWLASLKAETRLVSDWDNHALEFRVHYDGGFYSYFRDQNDAARTYEARGRLDVRRATNLEAVVGRDVSQEDSNAIDAVATGSSRADVITDRATIALNHRFNRLALQLRGRLADTDYDDGNLAPSRDYRQKSIATRATWSFRPTFATFAEVEFDRRDRAAPAASDGLDRSSDGERYRVGISLGQTGALVRGEASLGYGRQRPDESTLEDVSAFLVDANIAWRITPLTAMLFTAETRIDETSLAGASGVVSRSLGIGVRHALRRHLIGQADVTYASQDYRGSTLNENAVTFRARAEYTVNRHWALFGETRHIRFRSNAPARDYDADELRIGVRLRN